MDLFHALILGIVEGVTEFLPISSTGHLILTSELLRVPETEFLKSFEIVIQLGAILSVVVLYWKQLLDIRIIQRLVVAFIPTGVIGIALYPFVKEYLFESPLLVLATLALGGIALIAFEMLHTESTNDSTMLDITYRQSFLVGLFQSIAIIPGVSRSAATIVGGLAMGISRKTIVEFSFLLAVPTMAAATSLDIMKNMSTFSSENLGALCVGFVVSFVVALLSIQFLLRYVRTHTFIPFGIYRIAVAAVFLFFFVL